MKPYRIDFVNGRGGRGHEMTLDRDGGIRRSDLDELEINMLKLQRIPCLLPIEWNEIDGNVTFRYALNGKKMLMHKLLQQPLTMERFYGLLLRVVSALLECKDFMLRPEGCMLGDAFLFVGESIEDLSFVYVPLNSRKEESAGDDLLALVARWTAYIEHVDGEGLQIVLGLLAGNRWPLAELREWLLEALASTAIKGTQRVQGEVSLAHRLERPAKPEQREQSKLPGLPRRGESDIYELRQEPELDLLKSRGEEARGGNADSGTGKAEQLWDQVETSAEPAASGRRRWVIGIAFALGAACIWRFVYLNNATTQSLLISLGLTVLLLAGAVLIWKQGDALLVGKAGSEEADGEYAGSLELQSGPLQGQARWRNLSSLDALDVSRESSHREEGTTGSFGNYALPLQPAKPLMGRTSATQGHLAPTALLAGYDGSNAEGGHAEATKIVLKRNWNGKEEDIPLHSDVFQIGRGSGGKGYEENADGVSRLHLEIVKEQGCHAAKDLGSRNGSLLNGTMMIPYKSYPLAVGDTIQLAGNKGPIYQFKTS